jgi:hypothetical protein
VSELYPCYFPVISLLLSNEEPVKRPSRATGRWHFNRAGLHLKRGSLSIRGREKALKRVRSTNPHEEVTCKGFKPNVTMNLRALLLLAGLSLGSPAFLRADDVAARTLTPVPEIQYQNDRHPEVPWSIQVLRIPRHSPQFVLHAMHARGRGLGMATVSEQAAALPSSAGVPLAAINGDFYERQGRFAGHPRGLQVMEGELISAPTGTVTFWLDALGEPRLANTTSQLQVIWPAGGKSPIGLNEERRSNEIVLYTPALGNSTHTRGGREIVLEKQGDQALVPLRVGRIVHARVREVREGGNAPIAPDTFVLSVGPSLTHAVPELAVGADLQILTATLPLLRGVKAAISGGPVLVHNGKAVRLREGGADTYETSSAFERHPRSAIGWNDEYYFLVEVDGRQRQWSVGMTLNELGAYLARLGCQEAMNLDGGGSATLWYDGQVRNRPCDGQERMVANSIVVTKRDVKTSEAGHIPMTRSAASP